MTTETADSDFLIQRARNYLNERINHSLALAVSDLTKMLRVTKAADTDHASDCDAFARALIYDYIQGIGRPSYVTRATDPQRCPSIDDIARKVARKAADRALAQIDSSEPQADQTER